MPRGMSCETIQRCGQELRAALEDGNPTSGTLEPELRTSVWVRLTEMEMEHLLEGKGE